MDFLSQWKNNTNQFCTKIFHQISHVFRYLGQRDLRHNFYLSIILFYYCLIFFRQNNKVFDQYDPHAGGLGRLVCFPLVLMNRLNETDVSVILKFCRI